jgi:hypothetical protein
VKAICINKVYNFNQYNEGRFKKWLARVFTLFATTKQTSSREGPVPKKVIDPSK